MYKISLATGSMCEGMKKVIRIENVQEAFCIDHRITRISARRATGKKKKRGHFSSLLAQHQALIGRLEPLDGILARHTVLCTNATRSALPSGDAVSRAGQHHVKVHAEDAHMRVVLDAQIDVLLDTKAKVATEAEVPSLELVFLHLQALIQDFQSLGTANGSMDSDLLITADTKRTHGVTSWKRLIKIKFTREIAK